jgi:fatty acid synthase
MLDLSENRWKGVNDIPKYNGFISRIEKFDADFFGYPPKVSNFMDPQSRMILEHAYEAILDAGV